VSQAGVVSPVTTKTWTVLGPIASPALVKTPVEVYKKNNRWYFRTGASFGAGGDTRSAAALLTIQISEATSKPSNSLAAPTSATYENGVVAWSASGEVSRAGSKTPTWVRVGNRAGKWTAWVAVKVAK
jgi:hypothetical protein